MISFIHSGSGKFTDTGFLVTSLANARGGGYSYIWLRSNSLIKNLTPFEDDAEIRLLNVLM